SLFGVSLAAGRYNARFRNDMIPIAIATTIQPAAHHAIAALGTETGENGVAFSSRMIVGCIWYAAMFQSASLGITRLDTVPTFRAATLSVNVPICSTQLPMNANP